jgi:hypothetical protein
MKKIIVIMSAIVLAITANAQTDTTKKVWEAKNNPTVGVITEKYKDKYVTSKPAPTTADIFPALGKYESATNADAASVTISLDAENKGLVWIEGLPQGKIKAMLRKSPATYKIPAQKTEEGKDVAEGTALFDKETNTLSIVIGKNYNAADPVSAFAPEPIADEVIATDGEKVIVKKDKEKTKVKTKKDKDAVAKVKPWMYTGTKVEAAVAVN